MSGRLKMEQGVRISHELRVIGKIPWRFETGAYQIMV